jgi:hypothetical protein
MVRAFFTALLFCSSAAWAGPPRDLQLVAWSESGETALVLETVRPPEGGGVLSYRVVGPGVLQERHIVSNELAIGDGPPLQRVSPDGCREALLALKKVLRATRFKGVELRGDECRTDRTAVVLVSPELAALAEAAELESDGELLARGELRVKVEREGLRLEAGGQTKRLQLPRPIDPAAAHVLVSPSRRLLLLLVSAPTGEQVLVAGYSSRTGAVADFQ